MFLTAGIIMLVLISAIAAIELHDPLAAIICFSVMGSGMVILFILMQAPDVAMAQATIGTGLTTAFFIVALSSIMDIFK